ncbi:hypothetical protein [Polaribacter sp. Hel1_33_49]|jgi:hypothetical protein|uniref:hypothetical protein n=1 Tax=Polaribacter sp. Hel1_33_49 TaxID=1336803 RepID=UPI00052D09BB|nr:hypothetical protein [Polaribacter sp. Hel1_33_49]KGL59758.1 conserved hypothetical membrane protein [Polaribacter sp. Hel1_33_49]MBT3741523.1 hypothetical protein [Polaribacter sp.]MBT4412582.1 hypothetical protein [Polaribacter sp.]MBT7815891.1 hypothetical protein [Polaribacter sp.]
MEKSIESIWKEGFLQKNALVVPKLNNLYDKKSIHIIDKFKRMFKINLNALVVFSFVLLPVSFFVKIPVMGVLMFILFNVLVFVNKRLFKGLNKIDTNVSSYQYLKSFDVWMQEQITVNMKMSRYIYPYIFIAMVSGFWFSNDFNNSLNKILGDYQPDMIYGMPVYWILSMLLIIILIAIFGERIYKWDLNLVYGGVLKKLAELISDMEDLQAE